MEEVVAFRVPGIIAGEVWAVEVSGPSVVTIEYEGTWVVRQLSAGFDSKICNRTTENYFSAILSSTFAYAVHDDLESFKTLWV